MCEIRVSLAFRSLLIVNTVCLESCYQFLMIPINFVSTILLQLLILVLAPTYFYYLWRRFIRLAKHSKISKIFAMFRYYLDLRCETK